ncbi:nicotinamide-nucleotide adenylyltransferase, NadR type [Halopseudomonas litoralis]|uniref:Nicotinamide-nucleotide adenylyltransferase, NadR type n=1 Tax=Halopseudomonas litoralis TaxID=797277 RepID=A0A1H1PPV1_9GAMM|nr:AAA family ATPase [Halopseudomonas litoralis]SDS13198.1 nicotinamide-nucleotide adenylyltransferase, NadR type [Halopseudomonas litoralis]
MKVVVLTGPESTGKSWLAAELQHHFGGQRVSEYVREYVDQLQRDTHYNDVSPIAREQLRREDAARQQNPELLILDTNLLSNLLWSRTLFGRAPDWLEASLLTRRYDSYLLLSPEGVPWIGDGQRCQPELDKRLVFHNACRQWLTAHGQPMVELAGDWSERQAESIAQVQQLLDS